MSILLVLVLPRVLELLVVGFFRRAGVVAGSRSVAVRLRLWLEFELSERSLSEFLDPWEFSDVFKSWSRSEC